MSAGCPRSPAPWRSVMGAPGQRSTEVRGMGRQRATLRAHAPVIGALSGNIKFAAGPQCLSIFAIDAAGVLE